MCFWLIYELFFQFKACVALHLTASLRCHTECAQTFKTGYDACSAVNNGVQLVLEKYSYWWPAIFFHIMKVYYIHVSFSIIEFWDTIAMRISGKLAIIKYIRKDCRSNSKDTGTIKELFWKRGKKKKSLTQNHCWKLVIKAFFVLILTTT